MITVQPGNISVDWNGKLLATTGQIVFGHMGCKLLGKLTVPGEIAAEWDQRYGHAVWSSDIKAIPRLAQTLYDAIYMAGTQGAVLWDTMRTGSDFWRPGKLLTDVADLVRKQNPKFEISYAREDAFCPPADLLDQFKKSAMTFGEYATGYAAYLKAGDLIRSAAERMVVDLARNLLPVFYCSDPYIPGYAHSADMLTVPYAERAWLKGLRFEGCHRIVLAEELAAFFREQGIPVRLLEIDQTFKRVHSRNIPVASA